ncbi:PH domain-containing protein [Halocatena pleomorpha]|uniref:PH domain-containing protein n=1 Tax=Halocatena pleomorpha TaxID=1785090 RepID=A0A3P3RH09_9EURY|nr:PH domain-containing protein [Halocatena pleomorpha]RRJ32675.1 PH domain-containing protein [Halocatena pleomorpha]
MDAPSADEFEWLTLDEDEELLWGDTPHRLSLLLSIGVGLPLCLVIVGIPLVISSYLHHTNTNYVITTTAVYKKRGIFSRSVKRVEFDKVQNTSYQQSMMGSYFGYGTVEIATAGTGGVEMRFRNVASPRAVQARINERSAETENGANGEDAEAVLDEILAELQAIHQTIDESADTANPERDGMNAEPTASEAEEPS